MLRSPSYGNIILALDVIQDIIYNVHLVIMYERTLGKHSNVEESITL